MKGKYCFTPWEPLQLGRRRKLSILEPLLSQVLSTEVRGDVSTQPQAVTDLELGFSKVTTLVLSTPTLPPELRSLEQVIQRTA